MTCGDGRQLGLVKFMCSKELKEPAEELKGAIKEKVDVLGADFSALNMRAAQVCASMYTCSLFSEF